MKVALDGSGVFFRISLDNFENLREFKKATSDFKETLAVDNEFTDVKKAFDDINTDIKDAVDITSAVKDTPSSDTGVAELKSPEHGNEWIFYPPLNPPTLRRLVR